MKLLAVVALLVAGSPAQVRHWVPVATGPDRDPTGLYVDRDSFKGRFPVRTVWERFLNSYREERLSHVEMNCALHTWRTLEVVSRIPNGSVVQVQKSPNTRSHRIDSTQERVERLLCKPAKPKAASGRRTPHRS